MNNDEIKNIQPDLHKAGVSSSKKYTTAWWETSDVDTLEEVLAPYEGWEILQMHLVYAGENEAYRIVLFKS